MLSNSVCNHTRDKQIGLPVRGRPILLSLAWLQTKLDNTKSITIAFDKLDLSLSTIPALAENILN